VCEFTPPAHMQVTAGRMLATAEVEGLIVPTYSSVVRFQESDLELTCTPMQVQRGGSIACSARATPSGTLTEVQWSFSDNSGFQIAGPSDVTTWGGQMVRSGTVLVTAKIGGASRTDSVRVTVTDRTWAGPQFTVREITTPSELAEHRMTFPPRVRWGSHLGSSNFFDAPSPSTTEPDPVSQVDGGPNDGLDFFSDLSFPVYAVYAINNVALSRGSGFYNAQEPSSSSGSTRIGGTVWCSRHVVVSTLPGLVRSHELRHVQVYQQTYTRELQAVVEELERMTGDYGDLIDAYTAARKRLHAVAESASWATHDDPVNPNRTTPREAGRECALKNDSERS